MLRPVESLILRFSAISNLSIKLELSCSSQKSENKTKIFFCREAILTGRAARESANNLAEKLKLIREEFGFSQNQMLVKLGLGDEEGLFRSSISGYELGTRIPPFKVLLAYAKLANIYVDVLIDDELDLPEQISGRKKSGGTLRKT